MKMNMRKNRFWTLSRQAGGFTLVELIVVIAILAILAGVGIPVYSGYITRANKQADMTLVSGVANALMLQYYADVNNASAGYVVLTENGASVDIEGGFAEKAMKAAYGDSWATTASLKYSNWTDAGMLDYVLDNQDKAALIANSTYMKNSTPAQLVSSFSNVTDAMSTMVINHAGNPMNKLEELGVMSDEQLTAMSNELTALGVSWAAGADNTAYATAMSNLMVKYVADEMGSFDMSDENAQPSTLASMASMYSAIYAWASTGDPEGEALLADMNEAIAAGNGAEAVMDAILNVDISEGSSMYNYITSDTAATDTQALLAIMGAVSDISEDFNMKQSGLYSSESIAGLVNNYTSAIVAVADPELNTSALTQLPDGAVVIFVTAFGSVSVVPAETYLAGK